MRVGLALAALGLAAGGCSSSQLQRDAAGPVPLDAAATDTAAPPGGFVTGDVDGVTIRGEKLAVAYWFDGIATGSIGVQAENDDWQWALVITNQVGPNACGGGYVMLQTVPAAPTTMAFGSFGAGGACAVDVTAAAPNIGDIIEGTFTATLPPVGPGVLKHVTSGSFHVPRTAGMP